MKIAVSGLGRAGKALVEYVTKKAEDEIALAVCRDNSSNAGMSIGKVLGIPGLEDAPVISAGSSDSIKEDESICLIDFSDQSFTPRLFDICLEKGWNIVVCTTDHNCVELGRMREIAEREEIGMVYAPNLTLGVNLLLEFTKKLSKVLPDFDFAVVERHRASKPPVSATARMIAAAAVRHEVPIACIRAGGYVGIHEMTAASENERITIEHESFSRSAFANGAILAAHFVADKKGYFTMNDVIAELEQKVE